MDTTSSTARRGVSDARSDTTQDRLTPAEKAMLGLTIDWSTHWVERALSSNHGTRGERTILAATVTDATIDWETI